MLQVLGEGIKLDEEDLLHMHAADEAAAAAATGTDTDIDGADASCSALQASLRAVKVVATGSAKRSARPGVPWHGGDSTDVPASSLEVRASFGGPEAFLASTILPNLCDHRSSCQWNGQQLAATTDPP